MDKRIKNLKPGDTVRLFTYAGTRLETHSCFLHNIVVDDGAKLNPDSDGLELLATYRGCENGELQFQILSQNPGIAYRYPAEAMRVSPSETTKRPDLRVNERLIRRYEILKLSYSSSILPLD